MKSSKLFVLTTFIICWGISLAPFNIYAADKGGNAVTVVNTPSNPVPVTGNVGITGTPDVRVISPIQAVQREITCDYDIDGYARAMIYQVPQGKRLVIEYFSETANFGSATSYSISTTVDGYTVEHIIINPYNHSGNLRLYADSGADGVVVKASGGGCSYPCPPDVYSISLRISGYLVDVP